jgi:glycine cleavage system H lipoate-binding protein
VRAGNEVPDDLRYTKEHEWARLEGDGNAVVGITDYAQRLLGDVVFLTLPAVGEQVTAVRQVREIESLRLCRISSPRLAAKWRPLTRKPYNTLK